MLFGRKKPASWLEILRISVWPRRSWARSAKYMSKRILRLTASPHAISAGVAAGVFASFTPFLGLHFFIAFFVAYLIAGNFLAAAMGTFFGNPLTFPVIWAGTYQTGNLILFGKSGEENKGLSSLSELDFFDAGLTGVWNAIVGIWEPVMKPMLIGAVPLGIAFAISAYLVTRWSAVKFRKAQQKRREKKLEKINL